MTIGSNTARVPFACNGVSTVFPVPIQAYLATDFLVVATNNVTGAAIDLVLGSDYSLTSSGTLAPPQWSLTTQTGQLVSPYATGYTLQVILDPAEVQETQYVQGQQFPSLALVTNVDRITQMAIRLSDQMGRAIAAPDGDISPGMLLPPAAQRALQYPAFDVNGNLITVTQLPGSGITQASIGAVLYPRTAGEIAAGVTPTNFGYQPYDVRRYGAETDNLLSADDTTAFANAMNSASAAGGGIVNFYNWHQIVGPLNVPNGVVLNGTGISVGQVNSGAYTPANIGCALVLNTTNPITLNNRCAVQNTLVITQSLAPGGSFAMPFANGTVATNAVAAFAGNAFVPAIGTTQTDQRLENLLILGFAWAYNGLSATGLNRPFFRRVYLDCTNGIHVVNVFDIGRAEDCHAWEFTTTNQSFTTNALIQRSGNAFFTGSGSTWMKWEDCFAYGYAIGHRVSACQDVRQINCGADGPIAGNNIGFQYDGSMANVYNIGPTATAQGNTGFLINTSTQNSVNDIKIVAPVCHGNNSANGYVHVLSGNYSISDGFFSDNSSFGQIQLASTSGSGSVLGCTFANTGGAPIYGDAGAISRCSVLNALYQGTFTQQPLPTWTPGITLGGGAVGITYSAQLGVYEVVGRMLTAQFKIILTSKGSSAGQLVITGLPVAINSAGGGHGAGYVTHFASMTGLTGTMFIDGIEGTTTADINQTSAAGGAAVADTNLTNASVIYGTLQYFI